MPRDCGTANAAPATRPPALSAHARFIRVGGLPGYWITGTGHVVTLPPSASPRLAGNVLLWQTGGLTLHLEGRELTLARALELAGSFRLPRDTP